MYKGTKFNMRKEDVLDEQYLGLKIYRFYLRCPRCSSEITFKTDPKNCDYTLEHGAHKTTEMVHTINPGTQTNEQKYVQSRKKSKTFDHKAEHYKRDINT